MSLNPAVLCLYVCALVWCVGIDVMCDCFASVVQSVRAVWDDPSWDAAQHRLQALSVRSANQLVPGAPEGPRQPRWVTCSLLLLSPDVWAHLFFLPASASHLSSVLRLRPARWGVGHSGARANTCLCRSPGRASERKPAGGEQWPLHPGDRGEHPGDGEWSEGRGPLLFSGWRLSVQLAHISRIRYTSAHRAVT